MKCPHCGGLTKSAGRDVFKFAYSDEIAPVTDFLALDRWICIRCGKYSYTDVPGDQIKCCPIPTGM